jgi:glutamyl-tRNA synthetase
MLYQDWAERLLSTGSVYKDYSTAEERATDKAAADKAKVPYRFRQKPYNSAQIANFQNQGMPYCLRFKVPLDREIVLNDLVRGEVVYNTDDIADFVIMRGDGSPLYSFATVIDDALMSISHVIRSEEHLANTFPQMLIYEAMGFSPPQFAHLPYVAAPNSKKKMSKRDGGAGMEEYIHDYLPAAMMNYLARLGWSLDDHTEMFSRDELVANFSLERVVKAPASHDIDKLYWFQGEWMKRTTASPKFVGVVGQLLHHKLIEPRQDVLPLTMPTDEDIDRIYAVIDALGDRLKKFSDIIKYGAFFFTDLQHDMKAVENRLFKPNARKAILYLTDKFEAMDKEEWSVGSLDALIHNYGNEMKLPMGLIVNALRVAVTGVSVGPGLYDSFVIMGKDEVIRRLRMTDEAFKSNPKYNELADVPVQGNS